MEFVWMCMIWVSRTADENCNLQSETSCDKTRFPHPVVPMACDLNNMRYGFCKF